MYNYTLHSQEGLRDELLMKYNLMKDKEDGHRFLTEIE